MELPGTMTFEHCGARVTVDALGPGPIQRLRCPVCGLVRWRRDPADLSGEEELINPIQLLPRSDHGI
jgi:hypothetical protein